MTQIRYIDVILKSEEWASSIAIEENKLDFEI